MKQRIIALILIVVLWQILDFIVHGNLLMDMYQQTAALWRPEMDMKMGLMMVVSVIQAALFILIYCQLVSKKSLINGIKYGVLMGGLVGVGMGIGSYCYMPIPLSLAIGWFIAGIVHFTVSGVVVGKVVTTEL